MDKDKIGKAFCVECGEEMVFDSVEMAEDIYDDYAGDDSAYVYTFRCQNCGTTAEYLTPSREKEITSIKNIGINDRVYKRKTFKGI